MAKTASRVALVLALFAVACGGSDGGGGDDDDDDSDYGTGGYGYGTGGSGSGVGGSSPVGSGGSNTGGTRQGVGGDQYYGVICIAGNTSPCNWVGTTPHRPDLAVTSARPGLVVMTIPRPDPAAT